MRTVFTKKVREIVTKDFDSVADAFDYLVESNIIDHTLCNVFATRAAVTDLLRRGYKKVDAMWMAAESLCCSYEYVRKCVYYYKDVGETIPPSHPKNVKTK